MESRDENKAGAGSDLIDYDIKMQKKTGHCPVFLFSNYALLRQA